jgi:hypothetical protein
MYMSFSIVINSNDAFTSNSSKNQNQYLINWDFFPDSKYIMTFDFCSTVSGLSSAFNTVFRTFCIISIDGLPSLNYTAGSSTYPIPTQQVGIAHWEMRPQQSGAPLQSGILFCSAIDNPPLYLPFKPLSNILTVNLVRTNGTSLNDRFSLTDYVLRLHFTPIY